VRVLLLDAQNLTHRGEYRLRVALDGSTVLRDAREPLGVALAQVCDTLRARLPPSTPASPVLTYATTLSTRKGTAQIPHSSSNMYSGLNARCSCICMILLIVVMLSSDARIIPISYVFSLVLSEYYLYNCL
jgi:hypothetical protein